MEFYFSAISEELSLLHFQQILWNPVFHRICKKNICPVEFNFLPADEFLGSFITCMKPDITNYFILSLIYQLPLLS